MLVFVLPVNRVSKPIIPATNGRWQSIWFPKLAELAELAKHVGKVQKFLDMPIL